MKRRPIVLVLLALLFGTLGTLVEMHEHGPILFDAAILTSLEASRTVDTIRVVRATTFLGGVEVMIPLCLLLTLLVARKSRRSGAFMGIALVGSAGLNELVKQFIARPRPTVVERITHPHGLSFPSGHSQGSMAFAMTLVLVVWRMHPRWRMAALGLFLLPLGIGWTRAYLGVHYPTDILAGWTLAALWVVLVDTWHVRTETLSRSGESVSRADDDARSAPAALPQ